jgi:hypothetical protein
VTAVSGTITLPGVATGSYQVEWWDPYATTNPILLTQTVVSTGTLVLSLPSALTSDLGIKIFRLQ